MPPLRGSIRTRLPLRQLLPDFTRCTAVLNRRSAPGIQRTTVAAAPDINVEGRSGLVWLSRCDCARRGAALGVSKANRQALDGCRIPLNRERLQEGERASERDRHAVAIPIRELLINIPSQRDLLGRASVLHVKREL